MDRQTLEQLKRLETLKTDAVRNEDYHLAKTLKEKIQHLKNLSEQISLLESRKQKAIQKEDYDSAMVLKEEIQRLRGQFQIGDFAKPGRPNSNMGHALERSPNRQMGMGRNMGRNMGLERDREMGMGRDPEMGMGRDRDMGMGRNLGMDRDRDLGMGRNQGIDSSPGLQNPRNYANPSAPNFGGNTPSMERNNLQVGEARDGRGSAKPDSENMR